jgi:hypothetical protein
MFVQVIQGHVSDATEPGDGDFTQAMYFTSESEARAGERREPPPEARAAFQEQMSLMQDMVYYDLTDPWLISAHRESS